MISIIIRTKNEERWIRPCIEGIIKQKIGLPVEIILVDNHSSDGTVKKALNICPNIKLVEIKDFLPGLALNEGIRVSNGEYLVCLSAHCPPVDEYWLSNLICNFEDSLVAGVYGRQVPTPFTSSVDKRDLLLTFGLDKKIQKRDSFFHNANSMILRNIWEKFPFNEEISNIEDRLWGKQVIQAGYKLIYEPEAAVFHHHGIHQDNQPERARNVVKILEAHLPEINTNLKDNPLEPNNMEIAALIPLRATGSDIDLCKNLINKTIVAAQESKFVNRTFVSTEDTKLGQLAESLGAEVPSLRPPELTHSSVRADQALISLLKDLEDKNFLPDIIIPMEITYPFRPFGLIDNLILHLVRNGDDTVIAGLSEYRPCWKCDDNNSFKALNDLETHRAKRKPILIGLPSLGCATYPSNLYKGSRMNGRVGIYKIDDPFAGIEIRNRNHLQALEHKLNICEL